MNSFPATLATPVPLFVRTRRLSVWVAILAGLAVACSSTPIVPTASSGRTDTDAPSAEATPASFATSPPGRGTTEPIIAGTGLIAPTSAPTRAAPPPSAAPSSPTGDLLYFRGSDAGVANGTAWVVPAAGGHPRLVGMASDASWTADGRGVHLVVSAPKDCEPHLTTISLDRMARQDIPTNLRFRDFAFSWSPDDRQIAFLRFRRVPPPGPELRKYCYEWIADLDIVLMNADGTGQRTLIRKVSPYAPIRWSPDGTRIAFSANVPLHTGPQTLLVARVRDHPSTLVFPAMGLGAGPPSWSPDGSQLAFPLFNHPSTVAVVMTDGTGFHDLGAPADALAWAPDGTMLANTYEITDTLENIVGGGIALQPANGGEYRDLGVTDVQVGAPVIWSPDGRWLAYVRTVNVTGGGLGGIVVIRADGTGRRDLAGTAGALQLAWQPSPRLSSVPGGSPDPLARSAIAKGRQR